MAHGQSECIVTQGLCLSRKDIVKLPVYSVVEREMVLLIAST